MKRRSFLQSIPFLAAPLALGAIPDQKARPKKGIMVEKDKDRFNEKIELDRIDSRIDNKVSSKDTDGDLYIYEGRTVGKGGPPLHIHPNQDEWIHVIQGEYLFQVGEEKFMLKPGDSLFAPRNVPHAFSYEGEGLGKLILVFQPAGKMEAFFHEAAKGYKTGTKEEVEDRFRRHDMKVVGPRLREEQLKPKK